MSIALINHVTANGPNTFTTSLVDTTGASLLVAALSYADSPTISDNYSNTWTPLTNQSGPPNCRLYYVTNPSVGSGHTFTVTGAGIYATLSVAWFGGADTVIPFDVQNGAQGSFTNTAQPGSVTPGQDAELVVSAMAWNASAVMSSVTGMTILDQTNYSSGVHYGGGLAYVVQTSAETINPTWNWTGTTNAGVVIATFKSASSAEGDATVSMIGGAIGGNLHGVIAS